eukprot:m.89921 g.89921  ORF g.89921 m.89921 type:complete len:50 (+) comp8841_c5_seq1:173-322(+)
MHPQKLENNFKMASNQLPPPCKKCPYIRSFAPAFHNSHTQSIPQYCNET